MQKMVFIDGKITKSSVSDFLLRVDPLALKLIPHIRGLIFGEASKRLLLKIIIKKNAGKSMRLITKYQFLCLSLEMIKTTFGFTLREWKDPRMDFVKGR